MVQRCLAILLAAFATVSIYRVSYFVCAALLATVLHQVLAPKLEEEPTPAVETETETEIETDEPGNGHAKED